MGSYWLGVASGVPLMIAVGPIAVLLVQLGIERGALRAWPAALGVASADLTFATLAACSGSALQRALHPHATQMRWIAAALLAALATVMFVRAVGEIRRSRAGLVAEASAPAVVVAESPWRLAARLSALTMMNPLTIVAFTSLVVATGDRAAHPGWPLGIASASVLVHLGLVVLGSSLRRALPPLGPVWFRVAGSFLILGLATNLAVGH